jgi:hypothetical protein
MVGVSQILVELPNFCEGRVIVKAHETDAETPERVVPLDLIGER